jgi:hypothetical protein
VRIFTVHAAPVRPASVPLTGAKPARRPRPPVLLREGFSWAAFLFGPLWFAWHLLWWWALGLLAASLAVALLLPAEAGAIAGLALQVLVGMQARDSLRAGLAKRGQPMVGVIAAPDLDIAWFRLGQQRPDLVRAIP